MSKIASIDIQFSESVPPDLRHCIRHTIDWLCKEHLSRPASPFNVVVEGDDSSESGMVLSRKFVGQFSQRTFAWEQIFGLENPHVTLENGEVDHLSTLCYQVNYFQEYSGPTDELGRFPFAKSFQCHFKVWDQNLVMDHFGELAARLQWSLKPQKASRLFVSHDNDGLFRSFKQDGKFALKHGRIDWLIKLLWAELKNRPAWFNMDQIMDINDQFGLKSTFFWLVEKGRVNHNSRQLRNADYNIQDPAIRQVMSEIENRGFEQGLHKAIGSKSFQEEMACLPFEVKSNRNHFLRLSLPEHLKELDDANIPLDFSLGFAEHIGLRNSYTLPYKPWDAQRNKPTATLFVPLWVMDTSNWTYMKLDLPAFQSKITDLLEKHSKGALISILWHNKYFSEMKFKGYKKVYLSLLERCQSLGIEPITQTELIEQYQKFDGSH